MLIALLAVLGVDLIVVVALLTLVLSRKRWVMRQPGACRGAIRLTDGEVDGLRPKRIRGYGHWVRDVLVWTKAPVLFRNELIATDGVDEQDGGGPNKVSRLGGQPVVVRVRIGKATAEVAARDHDRELLLGPYDERDAAVVAAHSASLGQP